MKILFVHQNMPGQYREMLRWLAATVGRIAVISVGTNTFGHPTQVVLNTLAGTGAATYRTDRNGDVTLPLCAPCGS